jgi:hypothetical protein
MSESAPDSRARLSAVTARMHEIRTPENGEAIDLIRVTLSDGRLDREGAESLVAHPEQLTPMRVAEVVEDSLRRQEGFDVSTQPDDQLPSARLQRVRDRLDEIRTPENQAMLDRIAGHLDAGALMPIVAEGLLESPDRLTERGLDAALQLSHDMAQYRDDVEIRALPGRSEGEDAYRGRPDDPPPLVRRTHPRTPSQDRS